MNPTRLRTGDILHCTGKRLISRIIKWFTKSKFSHSALFVEIWGSPYIIDAQKDGVNLRPWDAWMKEYDYDFIVHRSLNTIDERDIAERALTRVGSTGYDFESLIFKQPIELFTGKWNKKKDETQRMYCSEFVSWVYSIDRSYRMSPEDLYNWCINNQFYEIVL
jgi:hypothetical protein